jgi:hypothetical protein
VIPPSEYILFTTQQKQFCPNCFAHKNTKATKEFKIFLEQIMEILVIQKTSFFTRTPKDSVSMIKGEINNHLQKSFNTGLTLIHQ